MKKYFILLFAAVILFSGCVSQSQKTVKNGDNISVDYTGSIQNGKVFDTSIESVAKENNLSTTGRHYRPINFTVGKGDVIKGFDEGVIGMKVGETKSMIIPPENAYGPIKPELIQAYPIIQVIPTTFPRIVERPISMFETTFGKGHKQGDIVTLPSTTINMTVQNISSNVTLSYNFKVGDLIPTPGAPWNETVAKIDDKNITVNYSLKKGDIVQYPDAPWNTTVIDINETAVTLRHNAIPETEIRSTFGMTKISFNETSIIFDQNSPLAGKTLVFNVTVRSIE